MGSEMCIRDSSQSRRQVHSKSGPTRRSRSEPPAYARGRTRSPSPEKEVKIPYAAIVDALMKPVNKMGKNDKGKEIVVALTCTCPFPTCTNGGTYELQKWPNSISKTNAYAHMRTCGGGKRNGKGDKAIKALYDDYLEKQGNGQDQPRAADIHISSHPTLSSPKDKATMKKIQFIILNDAPLSWVEDPNFRRLCGDTEETKISLATFKSVLLALSEITTEILSERLRDAGWGVVIHDGWTKASIHYFGMIASYNRVVWYRKGDKWEACLEPTRSLVSVSPIGAAATSEDEENGTITQEATKFNAQAMEYQIEDIFWGFYGINIDNWLMALIADNAEVNKALARLLDVAHVKCRNHSFNLDGKDSFETDSSLVRVTDDTHTVSPRLYLPRGYCANRLLVQPFLTFLSCVFPLNSCATGDENNQREHQAVSCCPECNQPTTHLERRNTLVIHLQHDHKDGTHGESCDSLRGTRASE